MLRMPLVHKPAEEGLDLGAGHIRRVTETVKANEHAAPVHVSLLRAAAVVEQPDALAKPVKQPNGVQSR